MGLYKLVISQTFIQTKLILGKPDVNIAEITAIGNLNKCS